MLISKRSFMPLNMLLILGLMCVSITGCYTLELFGIVDEPEWDYLTKGWEEDRATVYFDSTVTKDAAANLAQWRHERNKSNTRKNNTRWLLHVVDENYRIENLTGGNNSITPEQTEAIRNLACTISDSVFNSSSVNFRVHHYVGGSVSSEEFPYLMTAATSPPLVDVHCGDDQVKAVKEKPTSEGSASKTKPEPQETNSWNRETLYMRFLVPDDFPDGWQVQRDQDRLTIEGTHTEYMTAKKIDISFEIFDTPILAQQNFDQRRADAQSTIDGRGISGDKVEEIQNKDPIFVWMLKGNKDYGSDFYEAFGLTSNVVFKVYNYGSLRAASKGFASKIAKKQMDKLTK